MDVGKVEYCVQPAFNQAFVPSCPPSYSEAVSSGSCIAPNPDHTPYSQSDFKMDFPVAPQTVPIVVGPGPANVQCPSCHAKIITKTKWTAQKSAHIICCLLCFCGCCLCSCIPYCMKSFKDIHHYCPLCNAYIGVYRG